MMTIAKRAKRALALTIVAGTLIIAGPAVAGADDPGPSRDDSWHTPAP
jgi:hypothetical protein